MLRVQFDPRRVGTLLLASAVAIGVPSIGAVADSGAAAAASPSPSPKPALMNGIEISVSKARATTMLGKGPGIKALGTFVVVTLRLKNISTVAKRAKLEDSFVTTASGSRYAVSGRAMVALNVDTNETAAEVLHEVGPGFEQSYQLAFDVPKGHHDLFLHLLAAYPDVGEQRVFRLRV